MMTKSKKTDKSIETKQRILFAARKEFAEKGYEGARMGAIAKRADANQALLHYYFDTKENLYDEVLQQFFSINDTRLIDDLVGGWDLTPHEMIYVSIYIWVNLSLGGYDRDFSRIMSREIAEERSSLKNIMFEYFFPKLERFLKLFQYGIDEGAFETENSHMLVMQIISFLLSYENHRAADEAEFPWSSELYEGDYHKKVFKFLLVTTVKALTPIGIEVQIPQLSKEKMDKLDKVIVEIKELEKEILGLNDLDSV